MDTSIACCRRKVELICQRVSIFDAHWALFFLTRYTSAPWVSYALRASPTYTRPHLLKAIDNVVQGTFVQCSNIHPSDDSCKQASLPLRFGGLGMRQLKDIAVSGVYRGGGGHWAMTPPLV